MPTLRDVMQDPMLSNVSVKYQNADYVADQILPIFPVKKQNGKYYIYTGSHLRPVDTLRAAGSEANEVDFQVDPDGTYHCDDNALKERVPFEVQDQADAAMDPLIDATENITERLMVGKERALAALMGSTAIITPNNTTLAGTDQWSDYSNSDPVDDVKTAKSTVHAAIFREPNVLVLQKQVYDKLLDHPDIVDRIKYSQMGVATPELLARIFGVAKVIVAGAGYNSVDEGVADSFSYCWGKHAWLIYIAPGKRLKQITFGYTFAYKKRQTKRWTDGDKECTYVRVNENTDQKLVSVLACYLIENAIA